jgi:hypothetical protein
MRHYDEPALGTNSETSGPAIVLEAGDIKVSPASILLTAYCLLLTAYCLPPTAYRRVPLPTAYYVLVSSRETGSAPYQPSMTLIALTAFFS